MSSLDLGPLGLTGQEFIHLRGRSVIGHNREAVVVHVEDQVLAHDRQADQCDVSSGVAHVCSLVNASTVSVGSNSRREGISRSEPASALLLAPRSKLATLPLPPACNTASPA